MAKKKIKRKVKREKHKKLKEETEKKEREFEKEKIEKIQEEKNELESMLSFLEDQYRKAEISEKSYLETKLKYIEKLEKINKFLGSMKIKGLEVKPKEEKVETKTEEVSKEVEVPKEEKIEEKVEVKTSEIIEPKTKVGFLSRIFGRKKEQKIEVEAEEAKEEMKAEEAKVEVAMSPPVEEPKVVEAPRKEVREEPTEKILKKIEAEQFMVEIEKLRVMIETMRESMKVTDESIRTISESIGELRSMILTADTSIRETAIKLEKIEDDVAEVKPQEISKKFREAMSIIDRHQLAIEKLERKTEDLGTKINAVYEMLKGIGSLENIGKINKEVQQKLEDINEAVKYIERIGVKTEKMFVDLSKGLEDLTLYKVKQEDVEESLKEIIKSLDALNVKFESYVSKRDLEEIKEDIIVMKKQIEEINKVLPIVQVKLPETIIDLRKNRDDILLLLSSMEEKMREGKISKEEYESVKRINEKKLREIEELLRKEWKKVEKMVKVAEKEKPEVKPKEEVKAEEVAKEEVEKVEAVKEEKVKDETQKEEKVETKEKVRKIKRKKEEKRKKVRKIKRKKS